MKLAFAVGDRVRVKSTGREQVVTFLDVDGNGDPVDSIPFKLDDSDYYSDDELELISSTDSAALAKIADLLVEIRELVKGLVRK